VACFERYFDVLEGNPDVTDKIGYPVPLEEWKGFDAQVWLENTIERNPDARKIHAVDLYAERLGLELADKAMRYFVSGDERVAAWEDHPRIGRARVGIQVSASGPARSYPHFREVSLKLWRDGWEVFLFGSPGEIEADDVKGVVNFTTLRGGATFRESAAALSTCDAFVGPDSALIHVAGALEVPAVALYAAFPWQLRTAYAPKTFALSGKGACAPCFFHARPGMGNFPAGKPCSTAGYCTVLGSIEPEAVCARVEKLRPTESKLLVTA
jgi:ADP-heptose:LPS heptosyltransferase